MFEKFDEGSRKVMSLARQEALRLNNEFIGAEHILLGIIQEGGVAAKVLKNFSVDLQRIRQEIEKRIKPSTSGDVTFGQLPFSPDSKHVIELAGAAAIHLGHGVIGTEHLLLGLLKENESIAGQVLKQFNLDLDEMRDMVLKVRQEVWIPVKLEALRTAALPGFSLDELLRLIQIALEEAKHLKHHDVGSDHLLLAMAAEPSGIGSQIMAEAGLTFEKVLKRTLELRGASTA